MLAGAAALGVIFFFGCSDDDDNQPDAGPPHPDAYVGPCHADPVPLFGGSHQTLVDSLQIAPGAEGFDLDGDGYIDNILAPLGALANSEIRTGFTEGDIIIAFETFGLDSAEEDDCLNLSVQVGVWPPDMDEDGEKTGALVRDGELDCNDWDASINPDASEIAGDRVDNDCDGLADETEDASGNPVPSADTEDRDGDGYSPADGDCDDRLPSDWPGAPEWWDPAGINPGAPERCGDGFDNNCNGIADEDCDPYSLEDGADERIPVDPSSLTEDLQESMMVFRSARIEDGRLFAGPSVFAFAVEIDRHPTNLIISWARLEAEVTIGASGLALTEGLLGGVLSAHHMDAIPNIASGVLGEEDNTLLDTMVGPAGVVLNLPTTGVCRERGGDQAWMEPITVCDGGADCGDTTIYRCDIEIRAPDIDVDGDGIEIFLDSNLDGDPDIFRVDTCVDGDGTIYYDELDGEGMVTKECTAFTDGQGRPLFPDGFSIAMRLSSTPTNLHGIAAP
jgi:hypothetical protein